MTLKTLMRAAVDALDAEKDCPNTRDVCACRAAADLAVGELFAAARAQIGSRT